MHSGSNAEWKVGMGYLGYFVVVIIHDNIMDNDNKLYLYQKVFTKYNLYKDITRNAVVAAEKEAIQRPLPHFLHLWGAKLYLYQKVFT